LAVSVRLYNGEGDMMAQSDDRIAPPEQERLGDHLYTQSLALPVPVSTKPGHYWAELIVYNADTLIPLPLNGHAQADAQTRYRLSSIEISVPSVVPTITETVAQFDYIDLVTASVDPVEITPGTPLQLDLVWRPRPSAYSDDYLAIADLRSPSGDIVQSWTGAVGGADYSSGSWPTGYPVRERRTLTLDPNLPRGPYDLTVRLVRTSDSLAIPARRHRWLPAQDYVHLATVTVSD
jgi:hypothetical protein